MTDDNRTPDKGHRNRRRRSKPSGAPNANGHAPRPASKPSQQADGEVLTPQGARAAGGRNRRKGGNGNGNGRPFAQGPAGGRRERRVRPAGHEGREIRHHEAAEPLASTWWGEKWLATLHRFGW